MEAKGRCSEDLTLQDNHAQPSGLSAILSVAILGLVTFGGTLGGSLTYDWGFNVEVAKDHPVWHPNERDHIHPHDQAPK